MSNTSQIKIQSDWGEAAGTINQNFQNISADIEKIKRTASIKVPWATSLSELRSLVSNPYNGQFALVGETLPAPIYKYNGTDWENTNETGGGINVSLDNYYTKQDVDSLVSDKVSFQTIGQIDEVTL